MQHSIKKTGIFTFVFLSWVHMLVLTWPYVASGISQLNTDTASVFHILAWSSYAALYLLPSILLLALCAVVMPGSRRIIGIIGVAATSASLLFIQADRTIYDLYNFHFNAFVVNLVFTPGGLSSLGGGNDSYLTIAGMAVRTILLQAAVFWVNDAYAANLNGKLKARWPIAALIAALTVQSVIYGIGNIRNDGTILDTAKVYPFYIRVTFQSLAQRLNIKMDRAEKVKAVVDTQRLTYPLHAVKYKTVDRPPNIVLLVAESLRWDQLTPAIMPNTWALAQRAQHFTQHYSSGNGTREGLFGMFYGLYGSYWENFLHAERGPILMDRIQALNYQLDLRTSARFSYPEFDKTLFANVPSHLLHETNNSDAPWQNDEANASAVINFIEQRATDRPFMSFFFFESTHARYSFPDSAVIARPYLEQVNYGELSRASLAPHIDQLKNRYSNAAHWVDAQIGRIYTALEKNQLLDNTIIIVTGDHGEEFLEKGFWGHNSSFVEEQTHTPMVVWMPGKNPAEITRLTSHMDIATTLLQQLGAPEDTTAYSLGRNLFDETARPYIVIGDWHSIGVRTADLNYRIAYRNHGIDRWQPTGLDDKPYNAADAEHMLDKNRDAILAAIKNCSKFSQKSIAVDTAVK